MATVDSLLKRIKYNGRPLSLSRLTWWLVIVLTKLFGREVELENSGGRKLRILPVIWNKKVHLLGAQYDFIQADFTSHYTLRLHSAPDITVSSGNASMVLRETGQGKVVHIVLCHLPPDQTLKLLKHAQQLAPGYVVMLAYGGPRENFSQVEWPHKIFLDDPTLRGTSSRISYLQLSTLFRDYFKKNGILADWVFVADFDLIPLKQNYLDGSIQLMVKHRAGLGGRQFRDVSLSNNPFVVDCSENGFIDETFNAAGRYPLYHCLGCALLFRGDFFNSLYDGEERLGLAYYELAAPSVANKKGYRVLSFQKCGDEFTSVRFRPVYSVAEALEAASAGASFIHPVKEVDSFFAAWKKRD